MVGRRALEVATRAAAMAAARGVALPDDLALWQLAGGRPAPAGLDGEPEELGELLESGLEEAERRRLGAHFTPRGLARDLASRALDGHRRPEVGDPACGGGALLLAVARHLAATGESPADIVERLWAVDIDPLAVATTEASLAIWSGVVPPAGRCTVGDALLQELAWPSLDVVVGNPPFLSPLARSTGRSTDVARRLRKRFDDAVLAYTDVAALFLLQACRMVRPGGTVALLQPQSVLSARDAQGVRTAVARAGAVVDVWVPSARSFDAAVDVCVPIVRVGEPGDPVWSAHLAHAHGVPPVELVVPQRLGAVATTTAGFRGEYYGTVDHVREQDDCPDGTPLLTAGLVNLGGAAWGERPARVGGRSWRRPVVDVPALEGRAAQWAARTGGPKLVVATQTNVVEVVVDDEGGFIAGVPLVVVLAPVDALGRLAAALASPAVTAWLLHRAAGAALAPRALKVSASLLREVPLPSDGAAWALGADALRSGDLDAFVDAMAAAYGVGPEVGRWWAQRARSVWSPATVPR